jgi:hypothetical protein
MQLHLKPQFSPACSVHDVLTFLPLSFCHCHCTSCVTEFYLGHVEIHHSKFGVKFKFELLNEAFFWMSYQEIKDVEPGPTIEQEIVQLFKRS